MLEGVSRSRSIDASVDPLSATEASDPASAEIASSLSPHATSAPIGPKPTAKRIEREKVKRALMPVFGADSCCRQPNDRKSRILAMCKRSFERGLSFHSFGALGY